MLGIFRNIQSRLSPSQRCLSQIKKFSTETTPERSSSSSETTHEQKTSSEPIVDKEFIANFFKEKNSKDLPTEKDKLYSRLEIEVKSADPAVLKSYAWFATTSANHLDIEVGKCWAERKPHHDRLTLLKSVHIYKKHRVQYEIRTYFRYMNFHKLTGSTLDTFLEYIERNLPEGVALKATKVEIQELPDHLKEPPQSV